jgi:hypothetical protein
MSTIDAAPAAQQWAATLQESASAMASNPVAAPAPPKLLPPAFGIPTVTAPPPTLGSTPAWLASPITQHVFALVGVFVVSIVLLVAIRPPFVFTTPTPDDETDAKHVAPRFSAARCALGAFIATAIAGIGCGGLALATRRSQS